MPPDNDNETRPGDSEKASPASYGDRDERFSLDADPTDVVQRLLNDDD